MNRRQHRERIRRQIEDAQRFLSKIDDQFIDEVLRREAMGSLPAGYPTNSLGAPGASGSISDRTGTHALAQPSLTRRRKDPQTQAIAAFLDSLTQIANQSKRSYLAAQVILRVRAVADNQAIPAGAGRCAGCDDWCSGAENDRLRNEICQRCRGSWRRAGSPDVQQWIILRRTKLGLSLPSSDKRPAAPSRKGDARSKNSSHPSHPSGQSPKGTSKSKVTRLDTRPQSVVDSGQARGVAPVA